MYLVEIGVFNSDIFPIVKVVMVVIVLMLASLIVFVFVIKEKNVSTGNMLIVLEEQMQSITGYYDELKNKDEEIRRFRHDIKNLLYVLDKMLAGTTSEFNAGEGSAIDLSNITNMKANMDQFYELLQNLVKKTNADALLMNTDMVSKVQTIARLLGYKTETEDAFGKKVVSMDGVRFMDLGNHYTVSGSTATANSCVKAGLSRNIGASSAAVSGLTDIYAVKFDVNNGFHAASLTGSSAITSYVPDFSQPGAVKKGEVEMVAATVLKNTANAGVLRNIKIA